MFCFIRFLIDIKSPLTPELYVNIYIEMSRQALLYTAISALRPCNQAVKQLENISLGLKHQQSSPLPESLQAEVAGHWSAC